MDRTQQNAEDIARSLKAAGVDAAVYHAGLAADQRKTIQNDFMNSNGVVVATIAFGASFDGIGSLDIDHPADLQPALAGMGIGQAPYYATPASIR